MVKLKKLLDWNKNWCGSRYGPRDYDSGEKKDKRQTDKKVKRQKLLIDKKRQTNLDKKIGGPKGPHAPNRS